MFPRRRLPEELGALIEVHRPHHWLGWVIPAASSLPFALLATFMKPGPVIGLVILLLIGVPLAYGLAEWFLLQHRVHEHGIVLRTELPGTYCYVVPFATVDPDQVKVAALRRTPRGEFHLALRNERQNPTVPSALQFLGLNPKSARKLAKGRVSWQEATTDRAQHPWALWHVSFRDAEPQRERLLDTVRRDRNTHH